MLNNATARVIVNKDGGLKKPLLTSLSDPSSEGELRWFGMYRHRGMYILVPRSAVCD